MVMNTTHPCLRNDVVVIGRLVRGSIYETEEWWSRLSSTGPDLRQ